MKTYKQKEIDLMNLIKSRIDKIKAFNDEQKDEILKFKLHDKILESFHLYSYKDSSCFKIDFIDRNTIEALLLKHHRDLICCIHVDIHKLKFNGSHMLYIDNCKEYFSDTKIFTPTIRELNYYPCKIMVNMKSGDMFLMDEIF